jgi:hypothetical protein
MAGYEGDAHELVNHRAIPIARGSGSTLFGAVHQLATLDEKLKLAIENIPQAICWSFGDDPTEYTGLASEKALEVATPLPDLFARPR